MKFYSLNTEHNRPCSVLSFPSASVMLDCCLEQGPAQHFLPLQLVASARAQGVPGWGHVPQLEGELRENSGRVFVDSAPEFKVPPKNIFPFRQLDAILISNHLSILALPYIVNETGFKGVVLMTEPTKQMGMLLMKEMVEYIERCPKARDCVNWKNFLKQLPPHLANTRLPKAWRQMYSSADIDEALSFVNMVAFNETVTICGGVTVTAISSGFSVGSCNWIICHHEQKMVYMSQSCSLTTHPRELNFRALCDADVLIMAAMIDRPLGNPDHAMTEFCGATVHTLRGGGNVLVPCYPSGLVYDQLECLVGELDAAGLAQIPIYFISDAAEQSLAYSNIFSEWLSTAKQSRVYQHEDPFLHASLLRSGRVKAFTSVFAENFAQEYRQPCVVFASHPSLRFGDVVHFIEMWASSQQNVIIFTEPEFEPSDALAPFQPLQMRHFSCPIDTCINYSQGQKLLQEMKPKNLIIPDRYVKPQHANTPNRTNEPVFDTSPLTPLVYPLHPPSTLHLPLPPPTHLPASLSPALAASLTPLPLGNTPHLATSLSAILHESDGVLTLKSFEEVQAELDKSAEAKDLKSRIVLNKPEKAPVLPYGSLEADALLDALTAAGMSDARLEDEGDGRIVTIDSTDTIIQLRPHSTHVITSSADARVRVRDVLLSLLPCIA